MPPQNSGTNCLSITRGLPEQSTGPSKYTKLSPAKTNSKIIEFLVFFMICLLSLKCSFFQNRYALDPHVLKPEKTALEPKIPQVVNRNRGYQILLKPASGFAAFTSFLPDVSTVTVFCLVTSNFKTSFALTIVLEAVLWRPVLRVKGQKFEEIIDARVLFWAFFRGASGFFGKIAKIWKKVGNELASSPDIVMAARTISTEWSTRRITLNWSGRPRTAIAIALNGLPRCRGGGCMRTSTG